MRVTYKQANKILIHSVIHKRYYTKGCYKGRTICGIEYRFAEVKRSYKNVNCMMCIATEANNEEAS